MSGALRSLDVNRRPITTSFHKEVPDGVWALPTIDVVQLHIYDQRDFSETFGGPMISQMKQAHHKPVFVGEFGWIEEVMRKFDDVGVHMHDGLWSSLMGGAAGSALIWYWDTYVHPHHLERHFRAVEAFWRGERLGKDARRLELSFSDAELLGVGIGGSERGYLWIKNRLHSLDRYIAYRCEFAKQRICQLRGQTLSPQVTAYAPPVVHGAKATVQGVGWVGRYRVEWWDPYRGRITARAVASSRWGKLTLEVPDVGFDVAGKLIKLQWWEHG